ncbi:hypothetical protein RHSIM_Rhsim01G0066400 [Rhododendron simsii]|uniref:non-specific serine/threonine protein kinase n=1 Tax=Rhododendron simsii TaxID=118357 RepID=A0A834HF95_RHOSS|nr:hypothetical protein RHSIM_Rhsim01G0066400 [Rhododendron simsii]
MVGLQKVRGRKASGSSTESRKGSAREGPVGVVLRDDEPKYFGLEDESGSDQTDEVVSRRETIPQTYAVSRIQFKAVPEIGASSPAAVVVVPPNLRDLNIGRNLINGTIPSWVFELPALKYLNLSYNKLIGHIIEFQSSSLEIIDLSYNDLHGTVSNSTFELRNLTLLILSSNSFSGTIPRSNRFSENLNVLALKMNNFSGTIHDSFTRRNRYGGRGMNLLQVSDMGFWHFSEANILSVWMEKEVDLMGGGNEKSTASEVRSFMLREVRSSMLRVISP